MNNVKSALVVLLLASGLVSKAQDNNKPLPLAKPRLIAVVNTATWCAVCKTNQARFSALLMPYTAKGLMLYSNDLSTATTKAGSRSVLENAHIYEAATTVSRKGMGKLLQSCGLSGNKKQAAEVSGMVTFIDPRTHKQLKQLSIAAPDEEMKTILENLLK